MSENLASFVTDSAEKFGDRPALKLDDTVVNYALLNEGSARVAKLLKDKGLERGDRVGIMLPNVPYFALAYYGVLRAGGVVVPMNVLLKGREVAFYLEDSGAGLLFAWHDFADAAGTGAEKAGAELISVKPGEFEELLGSTEADHDVADVDASDTAVILYTSRHHGHAEGRRADPRQPQEERRGHRRHARRDDRGRRRLRRAAAVPLVRADRRPELRDLRRRVPDAAAALRPREGGRDVRARQGHGLPRRPDDVRRDAQHAGGQARRRVRPAAVLLRRLRDAGRGHEGLRGGVRLQDPRGLRAAARPRRSPPSTTRTASASRARSAPRSRASR